ncbi:uncharacterized protein ACA1_224930 [Acanthamoeba castellanii str. Neff]|uniref:Uncharacterized protein n=1 Tax=Acanthamoeba castellanii (strain ATCC 30010 / Neff) TaxID=1257118 RepID=L8GT76_ACACF|nr:uncharacterized protein ACA1_224930 [Acanthamoeba castellanii str. Neff]ELR16092.1 hypothetical protein ACA1_224930 [Acanthamoeba castellanii str. Neff]
MIYFEGVNADQVSDVLDDLKGIDVCYEVGQVMHDGFTKTMAVVLSATETDQVTQACQLIEQCYNSPGKFHPECTYNEKEVEKEVLSTLIDKGGAMINFNDYYFQLWCDFSLKLIIVNIKLVLPQVKPRELKELICKLCEVELVNIEFICCNNTYQGFVKGTVASKQDLLTILEHDNVELFIGCPKVHFHRKMSQEEFKKVVLPLREKSQANAANFRANKVVQDAARKIEQAKQARDIKQQEARAREVATAMQHRIQERMACAALHCQDP